MKQNIRHNVFETNSSSVHSLTILPLDEFEEFKKGNFYLDWNYKLVTFEEAFKEMFKYYTYEEAKKDFAKHEGYNDIDECIKDNKFDESSLKIAVFNYVNADNGYDFHTYDTMIGDEQWEYETFERYYTTKSGDEIVVFGYYGR
jgi:hypothetical protein